MPVLMSLPDSLYRARIYMLAVALMWPSSRGEKRNQCVSSAYCAQSRSGNCDVGVIASAVLEGKLLRALAAIS